MTPGEIRINVRVVLPLVEFACARGKKTNASTAAKTRLKIDSVNLLGVAGTLPEVRRGVPRAVCSHVATSRIERRRRWKENKGGKKKVWCIG